MAKIQVIEDIAPDGSKTHAVHIDLADDSGRVILVACDSKATAGRVDAFLSTLSDSNKITGITIE